MRTLQNFGEQLQCEEQGF